MSVQRSPPAMAMACSSPDLNTLDPETPIPSGAIRTRKQADADLMMKGTFSAFRAELLTTFKELFKEQNHKLDQLREDMSTIKTQIMDIKHSNECILLEHTKLKDDVSELKNANAVLEEKIASLENKMANTPKMPENLTAPPSNSNYEEMVAEFQDRYLRQKNILIMGIAEPKNTVTKERRAHDKAEVEKILSALDEQCPEPVKLIRLGKYNQEKSRPIKAIFKSKEEAVTVLRKRNDVPENVKIVSDETPMQKKYLYELKDQLKLREENGETNLRIKYVNGIPRIIIDQPKNENQPTHLDTKKL